MSGKLITQSGVTDESMRRGYGRIQIGGMIFNLRDWKVDIGLSNVTMQVRYWHDIGGDPAAANFEVNINRPSLMQCALELQALLEPLTIKEQSNG
jgi:hypothetical protein